MLSEIKYDIIKALERQQEQRNLPLKVDLGSAAGGEEIGVTC
jgi:hypothetical protein